VQLTIIERVNMPNPLRILILDDSQVIRSLLKMTLESDGLNVDAAHNLSQAMQFAQETTYDLIIADFMLEAGHDALTGLDFIQQAKTQSGNLNTPVIMLSAEDGVQVKANAKALGVQAWVKKPFTPKSLLSVVNKIMQSTHQNQALTHTSIHYKPLSQ
jgi:DNA-binding response OmpR family regulator